MKGGKFGKGGRSRGLGDKGGRKFWEVSEVENFYRPNRSANLRGWSFGKIWEFGRPGNLGGQRVWKYWKGGRIGRIL
jgi:hypothetical protein